MKYVVVTLQSQNEQFDLELPAGVPLAGWLPMVNDKFGWPQGGECRLLPSRRLLKGEETLAAAQIANGDILELLPPKLTTPADQPKAGTPVLRATNGQSLGVQGKSTLVGRPDPPRQTPDIDLTSFDTGRVTSRRQAQIWQANNQYWIKDLHSTNGLIVDGKPLLNGQRAMLHNGSRIRFGGDKGPEFIFYLS